MNFLIFAQPIELNIWALAMVLIFAVGIGFWGGIIQHDHSSFDSGGTLFPADCTALDPANYAHPDTAAAFVPGSSIVVTVNANRRILVSCIASQQATVGALPNISSLVATVRTFPGLVFVEQTIGTTTRHDALNSSKPVTFFGYTQVLPGGQYQLDLNVNGTVLGGSILTSFTQWACLEHPAG